MESLLTAVKSYGMIAHEYISEFGRYVHKTRRSRKYTQEVLAERSGLSADAIRRIEHGSFAASLDTLLKLSAGLDVSLATLINGFESGRSDTRRELLDLIAARTEQEIAFALRTVRALFSELDTLKAWLLHAEP